MRLVQVTQPRKWWFSLFKAHRQRKKDLWKVLIHRWISNVTVTVTVKSAPKQKGCLNHDPLMLVDGWNLPFVSWKSQGNLFLFCRISLHGLNPHQQDHSQKSPQLYCFNCQYGKVIVIVLWCWLLCEVPRCHSNEYASARSLLLHSGLKLSVNDT